MKVEKKMIMIMIMIMMMKKKMEEMGMEKGKEGMAGFCAVVGV